jgi:hypothetical protein
LEVEKGRNITEEEELRKGSRRRSGISTFLPLYSTMKFVVPDDIRNDARNIISPDPV